MTDQEQLRPDQKLEVERVLARRALAAEIAAELGLDPGDVYHQLRQLELSPVERLRRGLAHGRNRPAIPHEV